jgi:hypothetical protein
LSDFSEKGKIIAEENYRKEKYVSELLNLYAEIFENS